MSNRAITILAIVSTAVALLCIGIVIGQWEAKKVEAKKVEASKAEVTKPEASKAEVVKAESVEPVITLIPDELRQLLLTGITRWKGMCNIHGAGQLKMELSLAKMGVSRLGDGTAAKAANGVIDFVSADLNNGEYARTKLVLTAFELVLSDEATELVESTYADLPTEVKLLLKRFMK